MKRFSLRLLLSPDSGAGGNPPAASQSQGDTPPAPPPAAEAVLNSDAQEIDAAEIVRLRRENEEHGRKLKDRETRLSELEDENRRLKTIPTSPAPVAQKKSFLDGATFFG